MRIALTIAGSDSGGGAGIQADLKTFHRFGVFGTSVVTAITAQNTRGVRSWTAVPTDLIREQLDAVVEDLRPAAVKSGMIADPEVVRTVADGLRAHRLRPLRELVRYGDFHEPGGRLAMAGLLALPVRPDAVFVANNLMTLGALGAIADAGLSVPDDIAVVGFDDSPWAPLLRPPLTTVAQPTYDLGAETARMLHQRIGGYRGSPRELILSPELRVRASSVPRGDRAVTIA
jgi:hypothetical protein